jgi:hypothetical protein
MMPLQRRGAKVRIFLWADKGAPLLGHKVQIRTWAGNLRGLDVRDLGLTGVRAPLSLKHCVNRSSEPRMKELGLVDTGIEAQPLHGVVSKPVLGVGFR